MLLRKQYTYLFPVEFFIESPGHYTGLLAVQSFPNSIKTTLNSSFFCTMLSGASWTKLHKDFTCAMLSKEY